MNDVLQQVFDRFGSIDAGDLFLLFVLSSLVLIPRQLLCVFGGYLLGFWAIPIALAGSALGSALALLIARLLLREWIGRMVVKRPTVSATIKAVDIESWRLIMLLRLCSPIPGCLLNYFFGLTGVGMISFTTASVVGLTPQVGLFVYFGVVGQTLLGAGGPMAAQLLLNATGVIVTVFGIIAVRRRANSALEHFRAD
jgi:uncharacterized membrane protein YdjX (TVP38/TMEM64 family)